MGLDLVDLVCSLEDSFQLTVSNHDAARLTTPREVVDHFASRLPIGKTGPCLNQRAFYTTRRAAQSVLGASRAAVAPSTPCMDLLPPEEPGLAWQRLGDSLVGGGLPTRFLRRIPPRDMTVGDLARHLAATRAASLKQPGEAWTRAEVEQVVVALVKLELGVSDVPLDAHFVDELGAN